MPRSVPILFVVLTLLLAACGGEDPTVQRDAGDLATVRARAGVVEPTASPTATKVVATPTAPRVATATPLAETGVAQALLEASDLMGNWTKSSKTDDEFTYGSCDDLDLTAQFSPLDMAEAKLVASDGRWLNQRILLLSDADAAAALEGMHGSFDCPQRSYPDANGGQIFWDFKTLAVQPLGDDLVSKGFDVTYSNPVYTPMQAGLAVVRSGPMVIQLYYYGFRIDPSQTESFVRAALTKMTAQHP